jgi:hypothetical protein
VSSDKTPPARKTAAKATKPTASTPRQTAAGRATRGKADDNTSWADDADTAELPVQDARRRTTRRPGEDEIR